MSFSTRTQRIVQYLDRHADELPGADHPRLKKLAGMIQRNGLLQTVIFLQSKADEQGEGAKDRRLLEHLGRAMGAALGRGAAESALSRRDLATSSPTQYLLLTEVALDVATWMARHVAAQQVEK